MRKTEISATVFLSALLASCSGPITQSRAQAPTQQGDYRTITSLEKLPSTHQRAMELIGVGEKAVKEQDLGLAERSFLEVLELEPGNKVALLPLARLLYQQGRNEFAWECFHSLVRDNATSVSSAESDPDVLASYGELCYLRGDIEESRWAFEGAIRNTKKRLGAKYPSIRLQGDDFSSIRAQGLMAAGLTEYFRNHLDTAVRWTKMAQAAHPDWEVAQLYLADYYLNANPNNPKQAKIEFEKLKNARNPEVRAIVAKVLPGFWKPSSRRDSGALAVLR